MASENLGERERAIRSRNRALAVLLVALVALFYLIALVRLGGG
jgi:hypothetical protein